MDDTKKCKGVDGVSPFKVIGGLSSGRESTIYLAWVGYSVIEELSAAGYSGANGDLA
jgi:hypothetical protein